MRPDADEAHVEIERPPRVSSLRLSCCALHEPAVIANVVWQSMNPLFSTYPSPLAAVNVEETVMGNLIQEIRLFGPLRAVVERYHFRGRQVSPQVTSRDILRERSWFALSTRGRGRLTHGNAVGIAFQP